MVFKPEIIRVIGRVSFCLLLQLFGSTPITLDFVQFKVSLFAAIQLLTDEISAVTFL